MSEENNNQEKEQELDLNQLMKIRREKLKALQDAGRNPFLQETWDVTAHSMDIKDNFLAMEEQEVASKQVFDSLGSMKDEAVQVNEKSESMSDGIRAVVKDMDNVLQISTTILGSMDEMAAGAQQIGTSTQGVSNLAVKTKENIDLMNDQINRFKI